MPLIEPMTPAFASYLSDESRTQGQAEYIAFPRSEEEIAQVLRWCAQHGVPVTAQGGMTGLAGGASPQGGLALNLSRMDRILGLRRDSGGTWLLRVQPGGTAAAGAQGAEGKELPDLPVGRGLRGRFAGFPPRGGLLLPRPHGNHRQHRRHGCLQCQRRALLPVRGHAHQDPRPAGGAHRRQRHRPGAGRTPGPGPGKPCCP